MASGDRIMVTRAKIGRIADAIREKTSTADGIELDDMPDLIRSISGGGGGANGSIVLTTVARNVVIVRTTNFSLKED